MKCKNIRCSKEHDESFGSGRFCSRICANSRNWTEENKLKVSASCKKSEKVRLANIRNNEKLMLKRETNISSMSICPVCNLPTNRKGRKYHKFCWNKISGGYKEGSSRGKKGYYKGYWCDSSYELAYVLFNLDNNIEFKRNKKGFPYTFNSKSRLFYPDFIENDGFVEIKNFHSSLTDAKIKQFKNNIKILYREDLKKEILPYVIKKYGKNFIHLYEV